jgi:hypothetical protein
MEVDRVELDVMAGELCQLLLLLLEMIFADAMSVRSDWLNHMVGPIQAHHSK